MTRTADSGQGRVVVLIHGFPDTLVPDRADDALHLAEDAIGLLDALELKSAVFVGHD